MKFNYITDIEKRIMEDSEWKAEHNYEEENKIFEVADEVPNGSENDQSPKIS